jgi:hypothetical protein
MEILFRFPAHVRPNWIKVEVTAQLEQVAILINQNGLVPALEQMSGPLSFDIQICSVGTVDKMHNPAEILFRRFNDQVIVIRHQYICVQN